MSGCAQKVGLKLARNEESKNSSRRRRWPLFGVCIFSFCIYFVVQIMADQYAADILPWIILFHDIVTFIMAIIACVISAVLLKLGIQNCIAVPFSPTMYFYFGFVFVASCCSVIYALYLIIFWRIDTVIYNAVILYITGHIATFMEANVPLVELFLCIDRILSVIFPSRYNRTKKCYTALVTLLFVLLISIFTNTFLDIGTRIPTSPETECQYLSCLKKRDANALTVIKKAVIAWLNCISAFSLGYLMKLKMTHGASVKKLNLAVLHMMIISFFLDFLPNCVASIGLVVFDMTLTKYVGPYSSTMTSINVAASTILYWGKFKHILKASLVTTTTTTNHTINGGFIVH